MLAESSATARVGVLAYGLHPLLAIFLFVVVVVVVVVVVAVIIVADALEEILELGLDRHCRHEHPHRLDVTLSLHNKLDESINLFEIRHSSSIHQHPLRHHLSSLIKTRVSGSGLHLLILSASSGIGFMCSSALILAYARD
ncbi:hypothetical protein K491DRAFT_524608 [Lophiostoma macrostomum CBS 122681]|uniref:Uncharacterized protein n=1 Tax=Lophiostoma macrostomum CBS 122681 TaxID=1314788 RepID=A0A6A6T025_9PLEO|nr:hypothetical protein K491DRAFT_524608 [Lophiostoma macrostomum CBS 122681]